MKHQRRPTPALRLVCATFALGLVATACSSEQEPGHGASAPTDSPATATPQTSPPADSPSTTIPQASPTAQQGEDTTQPVGDFSTGGYETDDWPNWTNTQGIYPVALRSAVHDGFERIVIEHAGTGTPSMLVRYTDEPLAPGSGLPLGIDQDAVLEVIWSGTASIDEIDENQLMESGKPITDLNTTAVQSVVVFAPWEATSNYFIGLDEQRPFAVTILEDPVRLVVDIQTD